MRLKVPNVGDTPTALVSLAPARARYIDGATVFQRLRYAQGRTLTSTAMQTEQDWTDGRLGLWGHHLSAGVFDGLGTALDDQVINPGGFTLGSGRAIAPNGQDMVLHKAVELSVSDLVPLGGVAEAAGDPDGIIAIVLEPVTFEAEDLPDTAATRGAFEDACPPDPSAGPFLDIIRQDGIRVSWTALALASPEANPTMAANVAAHQIRLREEIDPAGLPWHGVGVPVAMMQIQAGRILWQHQAAVVRRGGILPQASIGALDGIRQSRVDGLVEETAIATRLDGWDGARGFSFLRHLPPGGLIARKAWDSGSFFPNTWGQAQTPIPESQLDAALDATRAMAPYDMTVVRDVVKWLVPVPDHLYAPDLLEPPGDPDFAAVTSQLEARVASTLSLRNGYRAQAREIQGALDADSVADFADSNDDPIDGETGFVATETLDQTRFDSESLNELTAVHTSLDTTLFTTDQRAMVDPSDIAEPPSDYGVTPFVTEMRRVIDAANDTVDFAFNRVQTEIYRVRQIMLGEEEATKLATFPVLAGLAKGSNEYALSQGLRAQFTATAEAPVATFNALVIENPETSLLEETTATFLDRGTFEEETQKLIFTDTDKVLLETADALKFTETEALKLPETQVKFAGDERLSGAFAFDGFSDKEATFSFGSILGDSKILTQSSETQIKALVDETRGILVDDALLTDKTSKKTGIIRSAPIPGDIRDTRSATIAERLKASPALTAKASAVRIKSDILSQILGLGIALDGLDVPLGSSREAVLLLASEVDAVAGSSGLSTEEQATLTALRRPVANTGDSRNWELVTLTGAVDTSTSGTVQVSGLTRLGADLRRRKAPLNMSLLPALTLAKILDPDPTFTPGSSISADDEAAFLQSAIATLESVVAILRVVEARLIAIATAVDSVEARIKIFADIQDRWESALSVADQDLDEARHDLRVARSLIDEEIARQAKIQAERDRIIAEEVKIVAYVRPRALQPHSAGDTLGLRLPGTFEDPLPDSLRRDVDLPAELETMMGVMREIPLGWFADYEDLARGFGKSSFLGEIYTRAAFRSKARYVEMAARRAQTTQAQSAARAAPAARASKQIIDGYQVFVESVLKARGTIDFAAYSAASWSERRRRALSDLSLNDMINAGSYATVSKRALEEIERIERVLHAELQLIREVPAGVRLLWTQQMSVFDEAVDLSKLTVLPSWSRIDWDLRRRLLRLNDWLFARMTKGNAEAQAVMSDIVRVAILLASQAPVRDIVTARIEETQTVSKGSAIDIVIRRGAPEIGMTVAVSEAGSVRMRGIVRDLVGTKAKVEVTEVSAGLDMVTSSQDLAIYRTSALGFTGV